MVHIRYTSGKLVESFEVPRLEQWGQIASLAGHSVQSGEGDLPHIVQKELGDCGKGLLCDV